VTTFPYDLAISAVPSDAVLVTELCAELAARLYTEPVWEGHASPNGVERLETLVADRSRLAVVFHQRLWQHDVATSLDAATLRDRIRERPGSVCVMMLDDTPVPHWLAKARRFDLAAKGLQSAATFILDALAACGGEVGSVPLRADTDASPARWPEGPPPFLAQPRAQSTLRHELDALAAALKSHLEERHALQPEGTFELHALPFRLIARLDDVGISFSWVSGRVPTVADGRLLVIEWSGVATEKHGMAALKSATPVREYTYRVEGGGPAQWQWRVDEPNGRAYSTANLLAEWLAGAAMHAGPVQGRALA